MSFRTRFPKVDTKRESSLKPTVTILESLTRSSSRSLEPINATKCRTIDCPMHETPLHSSTFSPPPLSPASSVSSLSSLSSLSSVSSTGSSSFDKNRLVLQNSHKHHEKCEIVFAVPDSLIPCTCDVFRGYFRSTLYRGTFVHVPHKKGDKKEDDNIVALRIHVLGADVVVPFKGYKNEPSIRNLVNKWQDGYRKSIGQQFCYPLRAGSFDELVCVTLAPRAVRWATFGNAQKNFAYACLLVSDQTTYTVELLTRTRLTTETKFVVSVINDPTEASHFVHLHRDGRQHRKRGREHLAVPSKRPELVEPARDSGFDAPIKLPAQVDPAHDADLKLPIAHRMTVLLPPISATKKRIREMARTAGDRGRGVLPLVSPMKSTLPPSPLPLPLASGFRSLSVVSSDLDEILPMIPDSDTSTFTTWETDSPKADAPSVGEFIGRVSEPEDRDMHHPLSPFSLSMPWSRMTNHSPIALDGKSPPFVLPSIYS